MEVPGIKRRSRGPKGFESVGKGENLNTTVIRVRVLPRSSRNEVAGREDGVFRIKLTAPPVEGRANKALQKFLADRLGVPKRDIQLVSGERSRTKSVRIDGLSPDEVEGLL